MNKFNNVFNDNNLQNKQLNLHNIKYKEKKEKKKYGILLIIKDFQI